MSIHPTAIIELGAQIGTGTSIGAYAYIGSQVIIGQNCIVHHHATIDGNTQLGDHNEIFPYAYIGALTQDLKYEGGNPGLKIGHKNIFREYTSIHTATKTEDWTQIENSNLILAYSHVAHDCIVGSHNIISSHAALGGHVWVGNYVNVSWGVGVCQFCRIGDHAMIGLNSKVAQDIPPYMLADGNPANVHTINTIGLKRRGFTETEIQLIKNLYRIFYKMHLNRTQALEHLAALPEYNMEIVQKMIKFSKVSTRGFA